LLVILRIIDFKLSGRVETRRCPSLTEAVGTAAREARPGDVVLLSPACASFDQFESFEDRGRQFQAAVAALASAGPAGESA